MTVLSWHVQNFAVICWPGITQQYEIAIKFELRLKKFVNEMDFRSICILSMFQITHLITYVLIFYLKHQMLVRMFYFRLYGKRSQSQIYTLALGISCHKPGKGKSNPTPKSGGVTSNISWWCLHMKTLYQFLAFCEENPPVTVSDGFPSQRTSNVELWCFLCH